ncbi:MAG TPA: acyl-CoA thioesterase [Polyangia bacterium]|nr:acyl-CoA thioesterase [Polyangia bacterium]
MLERIEAGRITEGRVMEMVFPGEANHYGTLFGGQALAMMDKAAFMVASRFARLPVVTASTEKIDFHAPVRQGELVELVSRVVETRRTSITVEVALYREEIRSGERALCTRGRIVLVALDAEGKPTPVPALSGAARKEVA